MTNTPKVNLIKLFGENLLTLFCKLDLSKALRESNLLLIKVSIIKRVTSFQSSLLLTIDLQNTQTLQLN